MEYYEFPAMNTTVMLAADCHPEGLETGFRAVRQFVEGCEQRFSRFRDDSELSALNLSAGGWFRSSSEMFNLIEETFVLHRLTGGLFDPSILDALIQSGYDRSMDEIRRAGPQPHRTSRPWRRPLFNAIRLDPARQAILLPRGVQIDLGGVAKGWIAERAVEILRQFSPVCAVSAGGDMALTGFPEGQPGWKISLEDPRDSNRVLAVLTVGPGAVATSSVTKRHWLVGDQPRNHIIDPRTGLSIQPAWLSVTVVTEKATHAEAFAKAFLISNPEEAPGMAAREPGLRWLAVRPDGSIWGTLDSKELMDVGERSL